MRTMWKCGVPTQSSVWELLAHFCGDVDMWIRPWVCDGPRPRPLLGGVGTRNNVCLFVHESDRRQTEGIQVERGWGTENTEPAVVAHRLFADCSQTLCKLGQRGARPESRAHLRQGMQKRIATFERACLDKNIEECRRQYGIFRRRHHLEASKRHRRAAPRSCTPYRSRRHLPHALVCRLSAVLH